MGRVRQCSINWAEIKQGFPFSVFPLKETRFYPESGRGNVELQNSKVCKLHLVLTTFSLFVFTSFCPLIFPFPFTPVPGKEQARERRKGRRNEGPQDRCLILLRLPLTPLNFLLWSVSPLIQHMQHPQATIFNYSLFHLSMSQPSSQHPEAHIPFFQSPLLVFLLRCSHFSRHAPAGLRFLCSPYLLLNIPRPALMLIPLFR